MSLCPCDRRLKTDLHNWSQKLWNMFLALVVSNRGNVSLWSTFPITAFLTQNIVSQRLGPEFDFRRWRHFIFRISLFNLRKPLLLKHSTLTSNSRNMYHLGLGLCKWSIERRITQAKLPMRSMVRHSWKKFKTWGLFSK